MRCYKKRVTWACRRTCPWGQVEASQDDSCGQHMAGGNSPFRSLLEKWKAENIPSPMIHFALMTQVSSPFRSKAVEEWADMFTAWEDMVEKYVKYEGTLHSPIRRGPLAGRLGLGGMGIPCGGSTD